MRLTPKTRLGLSLRDTVGAVIFMLVATTGAAMAFASLKAADAETMTRVKQVELRMTDAATKGDLREMELRIRLCIKQPTTCER